MTPSIITQHKTVPIAKSIATIGKGYPDKLVIFKIVASPYWYCRYFTQNKIIKRSTKTKNKTEAIKFAIKFYEDILLRERNLLPLSSSPSFERCAGAMLLEQQNLIERGDRNKKLNVNDKQMLNADLLPYFRGFDIKNITYGHVSNYLNTISIRNLRPETLKKHTILIHKILTYAQREGLVDRVPTMPKVKLQDSPRGWFQTDEYKYLRQVAVEAIKDEVIVRSHPITDEMRFLITFMVNSFLRPSDVKSLRHRNVQIVNKEQKYLRIQPETSKTVNTPIVTMEDAVGIYKDLLSFHKKNGNQSSKDDYVFFPAMENRDFALQTIRRQFEWLLDKSGLKSAPGGEPRTLYSLRHTSIMFRLTKGGHIDLLTLARNARTSVSMIERFYAKPLSAEMNIEMLQSKRR